MLGARAHRVHRAVQRIICHVRMKDVHRETGRVETNVGRWDRTRRCRELCSLSVGNIVAQVALQTAVALVIGVKIRHDMAALSQDTLQTNASEYPQLFKARVIHGDVREVEADPCGVLSTPVLIANNLLFTPSSNLALCCMLPHIQLVILGEKVYPRHSSLC
jgi:hypothetical protein